MDELIQDMLLHGLNVNAVFTLAILMLSFFIILSIKNLISGLIAFQSFRSSMHICIGVWIRINTTNGPVEGRIIDANRKQITIETCDAYVYIPTKSFPERDWTLLKRGPDLDTILLGSKECPNKDQ